MWSVRDIVRVTLNVIVGIVGALVLLIVGAVVFSRPPLEVTMDNRRVVIDTRKLGEYYVSCSLVEVAGPRGAAVLRLTSPTKQCHSYLWSFTAGPNDVPEVSGDCVVDVPRDQSTFELQPGVNYQFTIVGDNFFGHATRATGRFSLARPNGDVSSNQRLDAPHSGVTALAQGRKRGATGRARQARR